MSLDVIGGQAFLLGQQNQPPGAFPLGADLGTMQKVSFADDSDEFSVVVNDRRRADPLFEEQRGGILQRCGRSDLDYGRGHDIPCFHGITLMFFMRENFSRSERTSARTGLGKMRAS